MSVTAALAGLVVLVFANGAIEPRAKLASEPRPATASDVLDAVKAARGKVVLVNAWATWCIPCREEMPDLLRLRREFGERGFELVLVTTDFASDIAETREFLGEVGVDFPTWIKKQPDQEFIDGIDPSWTGAIPFTLAFDRNGQRVAGWTGKESYKEMLARVQPLLEAKGVQQ